MAGTVMPLSNGDGSFKGYTAKTVQAGQASLCGIEAAFMALSGFTAGPLEGESPRHHAFMYIMGDGKPHLEKAIAGIRSIWHSLDTGFKPYPVGIVIIGPVEICLDLLSKRSIDPDDIESVEVITYKEAYHFTGQIYTTPTSPEIECFLSIPFCVAVAIMDGELTLRQRLEERLRDPKTHELAARVKVREDEKMTERYPDEWPVEMRIHLRGGEVITRRVDQVKWSPRRPPGWDELSEKFISMAESVIGSNRALEAVDVIANLDEATSIAPLMNLVRAD
jgi:2-methylcitrate dehydratase PrpD